MVQTAGPRSSGIRRSRQKESLAYSGVEDSHRVALIPRSAVSSARKLLRRINELSVSARGWKFADT